MSDVDLNRLKITNRLIATEAISRGWGVKVIDYRKGLIAYSPPGKGEMLFQGVVGPYTEATDVFVADDKIVANNFAQQAGLKVPEYQLFTSQAEADGFLEKYAPIVVKPVDAAHGRGVSIEVRDKASLQKALARAHEHSEYVILQKQVSGVNLRLLFFGQQLQAAAVRKAAEVTGDGKLNVGELIERENKSGKRAAEGSPENLYLIDKAAAKFFLGETITRVPSEGEVVQVVGAANVSTGGYSIDVTDELDPSIVEQAGDFIRFIGAKIGGIDFIWNQEIGNVYFIEMNAEPSFGLHMHPIAGKPRPLAKIFLDWVETQTQRSIE